MSPAKPKYICTEEVLSMALFGRRGVVLQRLAKNGIRPGGFGFENMQNFINIIPELAGCKIGQKTIARAGDILRIVPDNNLRRGERHTVLVTGADPAAISIADDTGAYRVDKDKLYREWNRTGNIYARCKRA